MRTYLFTECTFRSFTQLLGEPENTNSYKRIMVVGWGKTNTAADGVSKSFILYQSSENFWHVFSSKDIKTVSTANQQKLRLPLVSIDECKERFLELGADLNLRWEHSIMTKVDENIENNCFSSKYHLCAGGVQGKDSCNVRQVSFNF